MPLQELARRCDTLIRLVEKENEEYDAKEGGGRKTGAAKTPGAARPRSQAAGEGAPPARGLCCIGCSCACCDCCDPSALHGLDEAPGAGHVPRSVLLDPMLRHCLRTRVWNNRTSKHHMRCCWLNDG